MVMKVFETIRDLHVWQEGQGFPGMVTGFVPTMGALHEGHLQLVRRSVCENDRSVVSIFVNPIQFNNPEDLRKYPRQPERDLAMLEATGCDAVFMPGVEEIYPEEITVSYDFGILEEVMEGRYRPGHFNGVAVVVRRLFDIVRPGRAYFGEKDFQQLRIIQELVRQEGLGVEIVPCPIVREDDGLAMSSRNMRLSPEERALAPVIHQVLEEVRRRAADEPYAELVRWATGRLDEVPGMKVEYFTIARLDTLEEVTDQSPVPAGVGAFAAVYLGPVRLIDNIRLF